MRLTTAPAGSGANNTCQSGFDDEVKVSRTRCCGTNDKGKIKKAVSRVAGIAGEIELRRQDTPSRRLHLDVEVARAARIQRRHDGLEAIAALRVGMLVNADILLERRTLLEWVFEPVMQLRGRL